MESKRQKGTVRYMIRWGVDDSHIHESNGQLYHRRTEARDDFEAQKLDYPFKIKQLLRLVFPSKFCPASEVQVIAEQKL
jgi:hypothetical protein